MGNKNSGSLKKFKDKATNKFTKSFNKITKEKEGHKKVKQLLKF